MLMHRKLVKRQLRDERRDAGLHFIPVRSHFRFGPLGIISLERKTAGGGGEAPARRGAQSQFNLGLDPTEPNDSHGLQPNDCFWERQTLECFCVSLHVRRPGASQRSAGRRG